MQTAFVPRVAVLGFGRFGRALGLLLDEARVPYRAFDPATDRAASIPEPARASDLASLVRGADLIALAVPVASTREAIAAIAPHLSPAQVVFDVGSVKVEPARAMAELLGDAQPWAGTHPLFGPMSLSQGERPLRVVLCPAPRHGEAAALVRALWRRLGCDVIEQTAEGHDRVMAQTHALTFFVAKGMLEAGVPLDVPFAPPSFQAIARTVETVRGDAGHLFVALENGNPFAADARRALLDALARVHAALAREAVAPEASRAPDEPPLAIPDLGARSPDLRETREHIDAIDRELVALLSRRAQLAKRAAHAKAELGQPVLDASRESQLLTLRRAWAEQADLDPDAVVAIFEAVLAFSRGVQSRA